MLEGRRRRLPPSVPKAGGHGGTRVCGVEQAGEKSMIESRTWCTYEQKPIDAYTDTCTQEEIESEPRSHCRDTQDRRQEMQFFGQDLG